MDEVELSSFDVPPVSISSFVENRMESYQLKAGGSREFGWVAPRNDSVSVLLFHRQKRQFMVMRQFRPDVFVSRVMQLPENREKDVRDIQFMTYPQEMGRTMELCTGSVPDYKMTIDDRALMIVEAEFRVRVDKNKLEFIEKFVTGVTESGSPWHLYYAEIDSAKYIGNAQSDSVHNHTVWLSMAMAKEDVFKRGNDPLVSSLHFYALLWWFQTKYQSVLAGRLAETPLHRTDTRSADSDRVQMEADMRERRMPVKLQFEKQRRLGFTMLYHSFPICRPRCSRRTWPPHSLRKDLRWDLTISRDVVSILIKDADSNQVMLTRRIRPAVLVGRAMAMPENEGKSVDKIDSTAYPRVWVYTQELASDFIRDKETPEQAVLRVASVLLGYHVPPEELKFVARLLNGSSTAGESMYLYYAECKAEHRVENLEESHGIKRVAIPRGSVSSRLSPRSSPPSVLIMASWMDNVDKTRREYAERLAQWNRDQAELKEKKERERKAAAREEGGEEDPMEEGDGGNRKRVAQELEAP